MAPCTANGFGIHSAEYLGYSVEGAREYFVEYPACLNTAICSAGCPNVSQHPPRYFCEIIPGAFRRGITRTISGAIQDIFLDAFWNQMAARHQLPVFGSSSPAAGVPTGAVWPFRSLGPHSLFLLIVQQTASVDRDAMCLT